ncbi:hypothetical protein EOD39_20300 [Acipenser ruthenus]|uniref:Uncharacterized protein n=1 Tax=Acipenser ruthenus TaxID=7906 RepID=A0A444UVS4_ACIRT|nr:hypothetical protein EOD39_20300 [Acipenser ruthenus]
MMSFYNWRDPSWSAGGTAADSVESAQQQERILWKRVDCDFLKNISGGLAPPNGQMATIAYQRRAPVLVLSVPWSLSHRQSGLRSLSDILRAGRLSSTTLPTPAGGLGARGRGSRSLWDLSQLSTGSNEEEEEGGDPEIKPASTPQDKILQERPDWLRSGPFGPRVTPAMALIRHRGEEPRLPTVPSRLRGRILRKREGAPEY